MYKRILRLSAIFAMALCGARMSAAQQIVPLYPNGVPGLKAGVNVEETNVSDRNDGIVRLRNVTNPTLEVYRPKKNDKGLSVIICPGGGYYILAYNHEGTNFAKWFAERGITAFVLKYRLPQDELFTEKSIRPLQDAQQAIRYVRKHADEYGINPNRIGIMGFSAGGHLAATASTHFNEQVGEIVDPSISVRPDFTILGYPVVSFNDRFGHIGSRQNLIGPELHTVDIDYFSNELQVTAETPMAFLVHANDDRVLADNSLAYVAALRKENIPAELHLYQKGGHGFGLATEKNEPVKNWTKALEAWLNDNFK
ncbi:alpha/beta hydrolase [Marinilongibacter aquaticus]|uniref:alpha/beta hydrolase n=1 Tax=Marinilongibacter aquaticus TaxID=2975157 RepID=UPI0021BD1B16|nr:alpha/beta hydrolase [Marinilongibacter aquaticus]UBM60277.1 alpha/beta hydrolase [Marinilongibacter aquaticus]